MIPGRRERRQHPRSATIRGQIRPDLGRRADQQGDQLGHLAVGPEANTFATSSQTRDLACTGRARFPTV